MLRRFFMLTLSLLCLFSFMGAKGATTEDDRMQIVNDLVEEYNESFLLSDGIGNFRKSTAETFKHLFHENAQHVNFFAKSRNYLMKTDIETYILNMQELFQNYELLRTSSSYEIIKFENIFNNHYEAIVRVESDLSIWPRKEEDHSEQGTYNPENDVQFEIIIQLDFERKNYQIRSVQLKNPEFVNLTFRLVDSDRRTIPLQQRIGFEIISDRKHEPITRYRTSDQEGKVLLSNIHRDDLLQIKPPEDFKFVMEEEKTAGEWYSIPENQRSLYLQEKKTIDKIIEAFRSRSQIHFSGSMGLESGFTFQPYPDTNISGNNADISMRTFSFLYAYRFLVKDNYELAIGLGAVRTSMDITTEINSIEHVPMEFTDIDDHTFKLILKSSEIDESFNQTSWDIPLLLTYRWFTGLSVIHSLDLTTNIALNINQDISFSAQYKKTAKGHYEEWNCTLENITSYGFINNKPEEYDGQVKDSKNTISYGLQIAANIPLFRNNFFLQTSIGYQRKPSMGNQNAWSEMIEYTGNPTYDFIPSMSVGTYDIGSFTAGFGFMYIF